MDNTFNNSNELRSSLHLLPKCSIAGAGNFSCMQCGRCNKRSKIIKQEEGEKKELSEEKDFKKEAA